jgi:hypothetical protein
MTPVEPGPPDWGAASPAFDDLSAWVAGREMSGENEAQTRFDVIDRMIKEVLHWAHGQVTTEEATHPGWVDYILRAGDQRVVLEVKRWGAAFASPTRRRQLKTSGAVLTGTAIAEAVAQAEAYARAKDAQVAAISNGRCWILFGIEDGGVSEFAELFFPFDHVEDAEALFRVLSSEAVAAGSLEGISFAPVRVENRLTSIVRDADGRVDRNNVADHIRPGLEAALYADAVLANADVLAKCFVDTEARTKFDRTLSVHLSDPRPASVMPARRIRKSGPSPLGDVTTGGSAGIAPPVTVIIGSVGAGKSTYLKHYQLVAGRDALEKAQAHWIYVDFEGLGPTGDPRAFMYMRLRDYIQSDQFSKLAPKAIQSAYRDEQQSLVRGPWASIAGDPDELNRRLADHLKTDFDLVEPYVDKVLGRVADQWTVVVILDNVDLYEIDELETRVFGEGLGLSKRIQAYVIVSIRDRTYARHRTDSAFDAYELRRLWLDPPPFREVLRKRLAYARFALSGVEADIELSNNMHLAVPDLSLFFDIVQPSLLGGVAGDYVEALADLDIRRGLNLVTSFLNSGHIQADRLLRPYMEESRRPQFPFHEVFKGTFLGQWKVFKEKRSDGVKYL